MKLLLDTCVSSMARDDLVQLGHDVVWAGDWPDDPGDEEILSRAHGAKRILVTLDKDFGELAIVRGARHSGIVRLVGVASRQQGTVCQKVLGLHGNDLTAGAIVTAEPGRLRFRPSELSEE